LRIVFAGTPEFAAQHLQALLDSGDHEIVAVYTQPDRPAGRGKKLTPSPVKALAESQGLPIYQPLSLKDPEQQQVLSQLKADIMVVVAYGLLLPLAILDTPKSGCINVHASLLPRWRGAAPIQRAIEAGDHESGITIMQMDVGLDTGDMLHTTHCTIDAHDTGGSLHDKLATIGPPALLATLQKIVQGKAIAEKQDDTQSNYAPKIIKGEALLDWTLPAETLCRKVRAFNPFPVTYTTLDNERIRIWKAELGVGCTDTAPGTNVPGAIIEANNHGIRVNTNEGSLLITELQLPGKKRLPVAELLKSRAALFTPGTVLGQKMNGLEVTSL
jgi:methionyl-tRNA formyltransferase